MSSDLKVKRLSDLLAELVDYTSMHTDEITDFTEGSAIRSIYEAIGMTQEQLYQLSTENVMWAIDHGILDTFDFSPKEAQRAYGNISVDLYTPLTKDVTLGKGTTVYSSDEGGNTLYFQTQKAYIIPQGTTSFTIEVYCTQAGEIGNIPDNYIDSINTTQLSVASVTNDEPFLTGREEETPEELKKRFREFVATRGRGTKRAIEYAVNSVPDVDGCFVYEPPEGGYFEVYAHNANGDLPDSLRQKVINAIEDYRPASIPWSLKALNKIKVSLEINLAVTNVDLITDSFTDSLRQYVSEYLNHFRAGDDLIANVLTNKILSYSSVIADVQYVGGATYTTTPEEIIRSGNIYISISDKANFNGANQIPKDEIDDDTTEPDNPTPTDTTKGTKLLGFIYYNSSYNFNKAISSTVPVSITYYDEAHKIITTLPYDVKINIDDKNLEISGNTYTLKDEQGKLVNSLTYDSDGSTWTVYNEKGEVASKTNYDNYGRVTKLI